MIDTTEAPAAIPAEPTTPIKPSEALRLGRLIRPKRRAGSMFWAQDSACAVGAISLGWGYGADIIAVSDRLTGLGIEPASIMVAFDHRQSKRKDGDQHVLKMLEDKGL